MSVCYTSELSVINSQVRLEMNIKYKGHHQSNKKSPRLNRTGWQWSSCNLFQHEPFTENVRFVEALEHIKHTITKTTYVEAEASID